MPCLRGVGRRKAIQRAGTAGGARRVTDCFELPSIGRATLWAGLLPNAVI